MSNYNINLQNKNSELQSIIDILNTLPDAGGVELPELTNPASEDEVFLNKEYIDSTGNKKTGTFTIDNELSTQDDLIAQISAAVNNLPDVGSGSGERVISIKNDPVSDYSVYYLNESGEMKQASPGSTFNALYGIVFRSGMYTWFCTGNYITASLEHYNLTIFKADGGII